MKSIAINHGLINKHGKLCFLQEAGLDIMRYNHVSDPIPASYLITQASLEHNLRILQDYTKDLNDEMKIPTPWSLEITHAIRHNKLVPIYERMIDALDPSRRQIKELAAVLNHYAETVIYRHKTNIGLNCKLKVDIHGLVVKNC